MSLAARVSCVSHLTCTLAWSCLTWLSSQKQLSCVDLFCFWSQQPCAVKGEFFWKGPRVLCRAVGAQSSVFLLRLCLHRKIVWGRLSYGNENTLKYRNLTSHAKTSSNISSLEREKWMEMSRSPTHRYVIFFCWGWDVGAERKGGDVWPGALSVFPW